MGKNKNKNKKGPAQPKPSVEQKDLDNEPKIVELSDEEEEKPVKTDKAPPKPTDKQDKVTKKDTDNTVKENKVNNKETDNVVKIVKEDKPIDKKEKITNQKQDTKEDNSDEKEPVKDKKTDDAKTSANDNNDKAKPAPQGDCVVCDKLAKSFCSVCKHVFYCTREHQRQHWSTHKEDCKTLSKLPYRVERNDQMGRFLVANTDIQPGQLIFNELPMIIGPRQLSKPVCLGCHKELKDKKSTYNCSRCYWPLCSRKCEDSQYHDLECRIIKAGGVKVKVDVFGQVNMMYACITVLRALALREGSQKIWKEYTKFESHLEERMGTQVYTKVNKEKVVFFIQHYLKLLSHFSDLEILEACGKLDTNCFELRTPEAKNLRAMYRLGSILSHDCTPNTKHTFDPDYAVNLFATVPIAKGSVISVSYTQSLWNTMNRRQHLKMSKCFWCRCARCRDPTEFGSYLSGLNCAKCGGKVLSSDPLDQGAPWRCQKCAHTLDARQVRDGHERLTEELRQLDRSDPDNLEGFLKKYATVISDDHQLAREIHYSLVLLNKSKAGAEHLPTHKLLKKTVLCKQLLDLADKIEPGMTKWRGQLLFEMQSANVILTQRAVAEGRLPKHKAQELYEESVRHLSEAVTILQVEPEEKEEIQNEMAKLSKLIESEMED